PTDFACRTGTPGRAPGRSAQALPPAERPSPPEFMTSAIGRRARKISCLGFQWGILLFAMVFADEKALAQQTYCNPLDLDYRYNFEEKWRNISYRSGADPVI